MVVHPTTPTTPTNPMQAQQLLAEGKRKYEAGDRMAALKLFEDVMREVGGWGGAAGASCASGPRTRARRQPSTHLGH